MRATNEIGFELALNGEC